MKLCPRYLLPLVLAVFTLALLSAPLAAAEGDAVFGKHTYRSFCSSCHGDSGEGDGDLAQYLTIEPTNLTMLASTNGGEFPAERVRVVIDGREPVPGHGGGDMPAWGYAFREIYEDATVEQKIDQLVAYLRTLQVTNAAPAR
ncbi:MAG: cytochrome c [Acidobacteriota bacterium]